jgi:hypothetical protein
VTIEADLLTRDHVLEGNEAEEHESERDQHGERPKSDDGHIPASPSMAPLMAEVKKMIARRTMIPSAEPDEKFF